MTDQREPTDGSRSRGELTRREYLAGTPAAATAVIGTSRAPLMASISGGDTLTNLARSLPQAGVLHTSDNIPSWYISVDSGSRESLQKWVDASDDRMVVRDHASLEAMTVRAPYSDVGLRVFGLRGFYRSASLSSGLRERDWVQTIDRNIRVSYVEPIRTLADSSAWSWNLSWEARLDVLTSDASVPGPTDVAFAEDASKTTMNQHKAAVGADDIAVDTSSLTASIIDTGVNAGAVFDDANGVTRIVDASKNFLNGETVGGAGLDAIADGNDHGTWCTSCAAARAPTSQESHHEGYLPAASILGVKALDDSGEGSTADILAAIEYAADQGADLIGLSLGSPFWSAALDEALEYAVKQGSVPISAAGNDRYGTTWAATPSDSDWTLSVSANTVAPPAERMTANFAQVGPDPGSRDLSSGATAGATPNLTAPGMETTALLPDGPKTLSGTSMAAPQVLGVAGLLLAAEGSMSFEQVRDRLTTYHQPVELIAENEAAFGSPHAKRAIDQREPNTPQSEAMTRRAEERSRFYKTLSDSQGGVVN